VAWRRKREPPITRDEVDDLIRLPMGMDWKLDRIMEEFGIDHGQA